MPPTEKKGRVQTSTVTVAVLPITEAVNQAISEKDLNLEWFSGTGAGGQYRNKHQNSIKLKHIPTGIIVQAQCRSRQNSYTEAFTALNQKVYDITKSKSQHSESNVRKNQVGSGERGDKVRTYRMQEDNVVDHITGKTAKCKDVLKGMMDKLWL